MKKGSSRRLVNPVKRGASIVLRDDNSIDDSRGESSLSVVVSIGGLTPHANTSEIQFSWKLSNLLKIKTKIGLCWLSIMLVGARRWVVHSSWSLSSWSQPECATHVWIPVRWLSLLGIRNQRCCCNYSSSPGGTGEYTCSLIKGPTHSCSLSKFFED